jgi:hypothetical protein
MFSEQQNYRQYQNNSGQIRNEMLNQLQGNSFESKVGSLIGTFKSLLNSEQLNLDNEILKFNEIKLSQEKKIK